MKKGKRYALFLLSLFLIGLGIALTRHGRLGVSPVSSVANVFSLRFPSLSFGNWLILSYGLFLIGQVILLRRRFQGFQLMQIPLALLLGSFSDFGVWLARFLPNDWYAVRLLWVFVGSGVLGLGIFLSVRANVLLNAPEAFVKALADTFRKDFAAVKIVFDVCWVGLAVLLHLILFDGRLTEIREGTILSAFLVGAFAKLFRRLFDKGMKEEVCK